MDNIATSAARQAFIGNHDLSVYQIRYQLIPPIPNIISIQPAAHSPNTPHTVGTYKNMHYSIHTHTTHYRTQLYPAAAVATEATSHP